MITIMNTITMPVNIMIALLAMMMMTMIEITMIMVKEDDSELQS